MSAVNGRALIGRRRFLTQVVLGNQVVFGSVNANPRHFAMGVKDFTLIEKKWPGVLKQIITDKMPWGSSAAGSDSAATGSRPRSR